MASLDELDRQYIARCISPPTCNLRASKYSDDDNRSESDCVIVAALIVTARFPIFTATSPWSSGHPISNSAGRFCSVYTNRTPNLFCCRQTTWQGRLK